MKADPGGSSFGENLKRNRSKREGSSKKKTPSREWAEQKGSTVIKEDPEEKALRKDKKNAKIANVTNRKKTKVQQNFLKVSRFFFLLLNPSIQDEFKIQSEK